MKTNNVTKLINFPESLYNKIEDYQYSNRIPNTSEAIRQLLDFAIEERKRAVKEAMDKAFEDNKVALKNLADR